MVTELKIYTCNSTRGYPLGGNTGVMNLDGTEGEKQFFTFTGFDGTLEVDY